MGISELALLWRRHWIAVLIVVVIACGLLYRLHKDAPVYMDSAHVTFGVSNKGQANMTPVNEEDLIIMGDADCYHLNGQSGVAAVRKLGGLGSYQISLVNFYNEQYPALNQPEAVLQAESNDPVIAQQTFNAVFKALQQAMAAQQSAHGTAAEFQIYPEIEGGTSGVIPQDGSRLRVLVAILILTLVAMYGVAKGLDAVEYLLHNRRKAQGRARHTILPRQATQLTTGLRAPLQRLGRWQDHTGAAADEQGPAPR
jgi:hypothetical protein